MSGFFPPKPLGLAGQEEVGDHRDGKMSNESLILADFEVGKTEFAFFVLRDAFDGPTREADV